MTTDGNFTGKSATAPVSEDELIEAALRQESGPRGVEPVVPPLPKSIGPYKIIRRIGAGGMGVVYEAEQSEPTRRVALKVTRTLAGAGPQQFRLFQREIQALARLRHPLIAQIYDAGQTEGGQQYFVMELIDGRPLVEYCDSAELPPRARLALLARVCEAVQYAQQRGVIHRDLKPSNILVDADGNPKILDFGLARITDADLSVTTVMTETGRIQGTLPYMSPEQARGDPDQIDLRSDVYSLGVILYELLTGRLPYRVSRLMLHEAVRVICEEPPRRPSTISRTLRGDAETIALKALEKDRGRRYQSVAALAEDLQRYLSEQPILARRPSAVYRVHKFVQRHRGLVASTAAVFVVLVAGIVVSTTFALGQMRARKEAERHTYMANISGAASALLANDTAAMRRHLDDVPDELHHNWEWRYLHAESDQSLATLRGHEDELWCVAFSRDGERLASADRTIRIWDVATRRELNVLEGHTDIVYSLAFGPDGKRLASGSADRTVRLWDLAAARELDLLQQERHIFSVAFSPDGRLVAFGEHISGTRLWEPSSGKLVVLPLQREQTVFSAPFNRDGKLLATGAYDGTVCIWDVSAGTPPPVLKVLNEHKDFVRAVAFSPDGKLLASGSQDQTIRIWDTSTWERLSLLWGCRGVVQSVAFSPDGTRLASGSDDQAVRIWDVSDPEDVPEPVVLRGHESFVQSVAFSPDGDLLASCGRLDDRTVRLWDASIGRGRTMLWEGVRGKRNWVAVVPDGIRVAFASDDNAVHIWDALLRQERAVLRGHKRAVASVVFNRDGTRVATTAGGSDWTTIRIWDASSGEELLVRPVDAGLRRWVFSPDGTRLALAFNDASLRIWDATSGEELSAWRCERGGSWLAYSPDGARLASGFADGTVRVWDASSGVELLARRYYARIGPVAFGPDGRRLACGADNGTAYVWDTSTGDELALRGHEHHASSVAFSPDGSRLASGSDSGITRIWDAFTGDELLVLRGHGSCVISLAFSSDGTCLVSRSEDNTVRLWDTVSYRVRYQQSQAARRRAVSAGCPAPRRTARSASAG